MKSFPTPLTLSCAPSAARKTRALTLGLAVAFSAPPIPSALAATPEPNTPLVFKALTVGDTESEVLRTLGVAPSEAQRFEMAGLEKLRLVFEVDQHRIEVTLIGGRLISKRVTTKPSTWRLPW